MINETAAQNINDEIDETLHYQNIDEMKIKKIIQNEIQESNERVNELEKEIQLLRNEIQETRKKEIEFLKVIQETRSRENGLQKDILLLRNEIQESKKKEIELQKVIQETRSRENGLEKEIHELKMKNQELINMKDKYIKERDENIKKRLILRQNGINIYNINEIDLNDNKKTPLVKAAEKGNIELNGININAKDDWGYTALMLASANGHTEIVKLLLEHKGIDINAKDNGGRTALMKASENGHKEIIKLLLEHKGIDINAKDNGGWTSLMYASGYGRTEIVKLLLMQKGIDINAKNKDRYTALKLARIRLPPVAALQRNSPLMEVIRILKEKGAT